MFNWPHPRILLAAIGIFSLLGGGIGLIATTWHDHEATLADWGQDLGISARLMESHLRSIHSNTNAHLLRIEDRLAQRPLGRVTASEQDRQWLDTLVAGLPEGTSACIHDEAGTLVLTTEHKDSPACATGYSDRMTLVRRQPGKTVISAIMDDRHHPDHMVTFSRGLTTPSGKTLGMAEILIDVNYFNNLHHQIQAPDQGNIFLIIRQDGAIVARHPAPQPPLSFLSPSKHPFTEFNKALNGTYHALSVVDGVDRLVSYRRLLDLDVVVTAGMTTNMVFRDWTTRTQRNVSLFATALLLLLALAAITNESLRHENKLLRSMEQKAKELSATLDDKDVLFQEVHHRVKNNLQVISSLLTMQLLHLKDEAARDALKDALDRIASMGLVHQTLYEHNLAANVDLGTYFGRLAEALVSGYAARKGSVTVQVNASGTLELERAVPLGMLANEALANALKHAFPDGRTGTIAITLTKDDTQWHFTVRDDGIGMPERAQGGIGLTLIKALARQLNGKSAVSRDGGTVVIVTFPV